MGAFRGAVAVGADGLETDIHLSKDGKVVLSHVRTPYQVGRVSLLTPRDFRMLL